MRMIGSDFIGGRRVNIDPNHNPYLNDISVSCHLKEIANMIFQSDLVMNSYSTIKNKIYQQPHFSQAQLVDYNRLQQALQYGWGIVVNNCSGREIVPDLSLAEYYIINQEHINDIANQCPACPAFVNATNHVRAAHYLSIHVNMNDLLRASVLNYKIVSTVLSHKEHLKININNKHAQDFARIFLAKIKLSLESERDWAKEMLFYYKNEVNSKVNARVLAEISVQESEILKLYTSGAFVHYKMGFGNYNEIAKMLETQYINQGITAVGLVNAFRVVLLATQPQLQGPLYDQLLIDRVKPIVELMFFTEVKRNSAALLTNAMFWDLVEEEVYTVTDIARKMPVAMDGAVAASTTIDKKMGVSRYDYRDSSAMTDESII